MEQYLKPVLTHDGARYFFARVVFAVSAYKMCMIFSENDSVVQHTNESFQFNYI